MKKLVVTEIAILVLATAGALFAAMPAPENPASGIWIQQKGDIVPHASTKATLYYTKFANYDYDAVKGLNYYYDGAGYLSLELKKDTICGKTSDGLAGADGIVHHPDGDLLIAGQGRSVHKVSKTAKKNGQKCLVKTVGINDGKDGGVWHLMMDPNQKWLWAAGIPGRLRRISTETDVANKNFGPSYYVELVSDSNDRVQNKEMATLIWDNDGHAFYTYSDYTGGGCETDVNGKSCDQKLRDKYRAKAHFGYISDTVWTKVTAENRASVGGNIGDSVITKMYKKILIDSLEGAHGGTFDPYSNTIFVFGGAKIVQIKPEIVNGQMSARVVAEINMREYFFEESNANLTGPRTPTRGDGTTVWERSAGFESSLGWRLDQGTVDGLGHLFVASNTGHLVFVDYAANPNKYISDNVLVHLQWIDNYLDDLAPLSGVGVVRTGANTGEDGELSSAKQYSSSFKTLESSSSESENASSSSKKVSSSSNKNSSSSNKNSSSSNTGSSSSKKSSSSMKVFSSGSGDSSDSTGGSSGSTGNSSGSTGNSSGSTGNSSGSTGNSSGSTGNSSGSNGGSSGSTGNSSGSHGGSSPSSSGSGSNGSSARQGSGTDVEFSSSSARRYVGFEDTELDYGNILDYYPSQDKFDDGDSVVSETTVLIPVDTAKGVPGTITVGENTYLLKNNPTGTKLDLRYNANIDSAQVGQLVSIKLSNEQIKRVFGDEVDSLIFATASGLTLIDPDNPQPSDTITVANDGSVTLWVTTDKPVDGGTIIVADKNGKVIVIDNINFYDPIPDADKGFIKDSDGDDLLDYVEIVLKDTLEPGLRVESVAFVVNGDTLKASNIPELGSVMVQPNAYETKKVNTIKLDVADLKFPDDFPDDAIAIITYANEDDALYQRTVPVKEMGSQIIRAAEAITNSKGKDSLFIRFNVDLIPADLSEPEMLVMLKQNSKRFGFVGQVSNVYMPSKDLVILVGDSLGLKGEKKDSVSLYPTTTFHNMPYITSDEYDREVVVSVQKRLPSVKNSEYWDTDGDGTLDKVVTHFNGKLTSEDVSMLYMTFPWYSDRGMLIQMQAKPDDFVLSDDSMSVSWNVFATTKIASGVTSISDDLPQATVFTYYSVLGETFISEEASPLVDKMSPVIAAATLNYGDKADTLTIVFSEPILYKDLEGRDYFSCIHGKDTIDLLPTRIEWAQNGKSAKLILDGSITTVMPGDSLMVTKGATDNIRDNFGNIAGENPQAVVIAGLLNHLVETTKMGSFDANDDRVIAEDDSNSYTMKTVSSVNLRYLPGSTTKEDMEKQGSLGQLVQLGERFVPQLLDRAQISADGTVDPSVLDSLDPEKVYITFVVSYYDHLGQYVNDTTISVPCNSPKFGGNCLATDKKVFVNWNFKDHSGRFVGTGIYMVQFKMLVRYENRTIEEEIKDKWGVRRKTHKKK